MKREYPIQPIVGVAAVIFKESSVLLIKRGHSPGKDEWNLPGGVVNLGETLVDALKREIREELSVEIELGGFAGTADYIQRDGSGRIKYHYVIVDYWGRLISGSPNAGSDAKEFRFVSLCQLKDMGISKEVKDIILKAFRLKEGY